LATAAHAQTPPANPLAPAQQQAPQPAQAQPQAPAPVLPPPGSLTTPPAPPMAPSAPAPSQSQEQPPGTTPQTGDQKVPEVGGPIDMIVETGPVIILKGQSTWDDGFDNLMEAFQKLNAEAKRLKLATVGRPRAAFTATDDFGFKFEAMLTLSAEPQTPPAAGKDFSFGKSPDGKALKFTHSGSYDDIDTTYEAITAYLDEKGLKARNIFVEEYMTDPKNSEDASLEMNIYVLVE
jgi:effector-binding domain-containing protein